MPVLGVSPAKKGTCGRCGSVLEQMDHPTGAVVLMCSGCGLVVGRGEEARKVLAGYIADGYAVEEPAAEGVYAMQLLIPSHGDA